MRRQPQQSTENADAAYWRRVLYPLYVPGSVLPRDAPITETVTNVVRHAAALDRLDAAGGRNERKRIPLMRKHVAAMRDWAKATRDRDGADVRGWQVATARALLAQPWRDDDAVVRVVGPWVVNVITQAVAAATMRPTQSRGGRHGKGQSKRQHTELIHRIVKRHGGSPE